jgi:hypothetical protein
LLLAAHGRLFSFYSRLQQPYTQMLITPPALLSSNEDLFPSMKLIFIDVAVFSTGNWIGTRFDLS